MANTRMFYDWSVDKCPKQSVLVDNFTEETPFIRILPMEASSHGLENVREEVVNIIGGDMTDLNGPSPAIDATTGLERETLKRISGKITVPINTAQQYGGADAYYAKKMPLILQNTGEKTEQTILYNSFRAHAVAADARTVAAGVGTRHLIDAGGVGSTNYSMIAITFKPGVVNGLYDSTRFNTGSSPNMFEFVKMFNGGLGNVTIDSKEVEAYQMLMQSFMGIQIASDRYVSAIVNIDIANDKLPTETQMDALIQSVRANSNTWLVMHPDVRTALQTYKGTNLQNVNFEREVNRLTDAYNSVPFLTTWNMQQGDEDKVTVS